MSLRVRHSGAISFLPHRCPMCWRRQEKGEVLSQGREAVPVLVSCLRHKVRTTTLTCHNPEHIFPLCSTHSLPFSSPLLPSFLPSLHPSFPFPSFPSFPFSSTVLSPPERAGEFVFSGYITSCLWN